MDSILKLVYDYWYYDRPFGNGAHPVLIANLQKQLKEKNITPDEAKGGIQSADMPGDLFPFRSHNNFLGYFEKHLPDNKLLRVQEIIDDNSIYLYPLEIRTCLDSLYKEYTFSLDGVEYNYSLKDTFSPETLKHLQTGKVKLLINFIHDPISHSADLINLEKYINDAGIDGSNVILIAGNSYDQLYIDKPDCKIKLTHDMLLLPQCALEMTQFPRIANLGYICDVVREADLDPKVYRSKKIICLNRTIKPHRLLLACFALKYNLMNDSFFTLLGHFDKTIIINHVQDLYPGALEDSTEIAKDTKELIPLELDIIKPHKLSAWFNLKYNLIRDSFFTLLGHFDKTNTMPRNYKSLKEIAKELEEMVPLELDTMHLDGDNKVNFSTANTNKEWYVNSYINITSETRFEQGDSVFFSEKVFRPIVNLQPFILVGNYHSLRTLHELGFKTFHPFIDESYDTETDARKRIIMIEKEIEKISNKSIKEIHKWYYSITDILIHNKRHLETFKNHNPFQKALDDIIIFYNKGT